MISTNLELNINTLKQYTIKMAQRCDQSLDNASNCILNKDLDQAKKIINDDEEINVLREYIIDRSIELMALKQPMAKDLRYIYALDNIALELERIGDYTANIAEEILNIDEEKYIKIVVDIPKMIEECKEMLLSSIEALKNDDEELAYNTALRDDTVDIIYKKIYKDCSQIMNEDLSKVNQGIRLLFIARYLERIGDHITNICEKIIYAIKGEMIEIG